MKFNLQTTIFFIVFLYILYSFNGYPLLTNDTTYFLPTSFEIKYQHSLTNTFYNGGFNNGNKFLFYPPLFPAVISVLLLVDHVSILFLSINLINILSLLFVGRIILILNKSEKINLLTFLYVIACVSFLSPSYSRPELLVNLIYYSFILIHLRSFDSRYIITGALIVLCALTSPVNAFYLCIIGLLVMIHKKEISGYNIFQTFTGAVIVAFSFYLLYPYNIIDLLQTMKIHAANSISNRNDLFTFTQFLKYHIFNPFGSFGIFIMATATFIVVNSITKSKIKLKSISIFLFTTLFTSFTYLGFRSIFLSYNIYSLIPFALFIIYYFSQTNKTLKFKKLATLLFSTASISFLYTIATFIIASTQNPISIDKIKKEISPILMSNNKSIAFTPSFWPIFKSPATKCKYEIYTNNNATSDFILMQQYATGLQKPPLIPGYELVVNKFDKPFLVFDIIKVYKYKPFYQYALFKKINYKIPQNFTKKINGAGNFK
jgi:hypothetical protein